MTSAEPQVAALPRRNPLPCLCSSALPPASISRSHSVCRLCLKSSTLHSSMGLFSSHTRLHLPVPFHLQGACLPHCFSVFEFLAVDIIPLVVVLFSWNIPSPCILFLVLPLIDASKSSIFLLFSTPLWMPLLVDSSPLKETHDSVFLPLCVLKFSFVFLAFLFVPLASSISWSIP